MSLKLTLTIKEKKSDTTCDALRGIKYGQYRKINFRHKKYV